MQNITNSVSYFATEGSDIPDPKRIRAERRDAFSLTEDTITVSWYAGSGGNPMTGSEEFISWWDLMKKKILREKFGISPDSAIVE